MNERHPSYRHYGKRGITICPQWQDDFDQFLKDMGHRPEGMSLERKNNEGHYTPENCTWGTRCEQAGNTRRNIVVEWQGAACNLMDVARTEQVDYPCLRYRYNNGMDLVEAVALLKSQGLKFHERSTEKGSTRKNKTAATRTPRNFWK